MTQQMLKFVSVETQRPKKRPAARRRRDFDEIYHGFDLMQRRSKPVAVPNAACHFAKFIARSATIFRIGCS